MVNVVIAYNLYFLFLCKVLIALYFSYSIAIALGSSNYTGDEYSDTYPDL